MAQPIELYSSHSSSVGCAIKQTTDMLSSWLIESRRLRNRDLRDSEIAMYYLCSEYYLSTLRIIV